MVKAYNRGESKLEILTKCDKLYIEAVRIAKSQKHIPKKYEKLLGWKFIEDIRNVVQCIAAANDFNLNDVEEAKLRKSC